MQGLQLLDRFDHNSTESLHGPVTVGAHPNAFRKVQLLDFDPIIVGQIRRQPIWEPSNIHGLETNHIGSSSDHFLANPIFTTKFCFIWNSHFD